MSVATVRLYRATTCPDFAAKARAAMPSWLRDGYEASEGARAAGRWFLSDPALLDWYLDDVGRDRAQVVVIDVPSADLEAYRVSNIERTADDLNPHAYSRDPENEFFLPAELAGAARPLA